MILQLFYLILSILALYWGAELALESAEKIGWSLGLSPLVIGLFIVGFGTSLPEFFASHAASLHGQFPMAIGNIIGSNLANILLIFGLLGLISEFVLSNKAIGRQLLFHLLLSVFFTIVMLQTELGLASGLLLGVLFVAYLSINIHKMERWRSHLEKKVVEMKSISFLILGLAFLYGGGELLVYSGRALGTIFGVSTFIISAVLVALGTSLPELVMALVIVKKKKNPDLIIGNLIGSNVFNVAFVLASLGIYRIPLKSSYVYDTLTLLFAALFLVILYILKRNFGKLFGFSFLVLYGLTLVRWIYYTNPES